MRTQKIFSILLVFMALSFFSFGPSGRDHAKAEVTGPQTWTFQATQSAYVRSMAPDTNYSANNALWAQYYVSDNRFSYIKFDLSSIPVGAEVTAATLRLYIYNVTDYSYCHGSPTGLFEAGKLVSDWQENTITWNNRPSTGVITNTNPVTVTCPAQNGWQSFGALNPVKKWIELGEPNYGLQFDGTAVGQGNWVRAFYSSRATYKPELQITYNDATAPNFTSLGVNSITQNSAKVSWTSNETTAANLYWGTTASYGNTRGIASGTNEYVLSSLSPGTTYHYKVMIVDNFGNTKESGDNTFTTLADSTAAASPSATSSNPTATVTPTTKKTATASSAKEAVKVVDESIATPVVEYVGVGNKKVDAPFKNAIKASLKDTLTIAGSSFASAGVVIIIGEKAFSTDADGTGKWEIKIAVKDIKVGKYEVKAQAQDAAKNKGSEIVKAFDLSVAKASPSAKKEQEAKEAKKFLSTFQIISGLIILGLVLGTVALLNRDKLARLLRKKPETNSQDK